MIVLALAIQLGPGMAKAESDPAPGLRMHLSFDKTEGLSVIEDSHLNPGQIDHFPQADYARGDGVPRNVNRVLPIEGRFGQGALIPAGGGLSFDARDHVHPYGGSLAFWVKFPESPWDAPFRQGRFPVVIKIGDGQWTLRGISHLKMGINSVDEVIEIREGGRNPVWHPRDLQLEQIETRWGVDFSNWTLPETIAVQWAPGDALQTGQWHHFVITWDPQRGRKMYFDGERVADWDGPEFRAPYVAQLALSNNITRSVDIANSLPIAYDEVYMLDYPLNAAQVGALYAENQLPADPDELPQPTTPQWAMLDNWDDPAIPQYPGAVWAITQILPTGVFNVTAQRHEAIDGKMHNTWPPLYKDFGEAPGDYRLDITFDGDLDADYLRLTGGFTGIFRAADDSGSPVVFDGAHYIQRHPLAVEQGGRKWFFDRADGFISRIDFFTLSRIEPGLVGEFNLTGLVLKTGDFWDWQSGYDRPYARTGMRKPDGGRGESDLIGTGPLQANVPRYLFTEPITAPTAVDMLYLKLDGLADNSVFNIQIQDPVYANREILDFEFRTGKLDGQPVELMLYPAEPLLMLEGDRLALRLLGSRSGSADLSTSLSVHMIEPGDMDQYHRTERLISDLFLHLSEPQRWVTLRPRGGSIPRVQMHGTEELMARCEHLLQFFPQQPTVAAIYSWIGRRARFWTSDEQQRWQDPFADYAPDLGLSDNGAPEWARYWRRAMEVFRKYPDWWIDMRQSPQGEFGGGINDDSTMIPDWVGLAMVYDPGERYRRSFEKLADLAWNVNMPDGLTIDPKGLLHAFEQGINIASLMPLLRYGDPIWIERLMATSRWYDGHLTALTPKGTRHYRSHWVSAVEIPVDGIDAGFDPPFKAGRYLVWYNGNPEVLRVLREWQDSWLSYGDDPKNPFGGKRIDFATGKPVAGAPPNHMWQHLQWLYRMTGDERYRKPMFDGWRHSGPAPGLSHWREWRRIDPEPEIDAIILNRMRRQQFEDVEVSITSMRGDIESLEKYLPIHTSVGQSTDRVAVGSYEAIRMALGGFPTYAKRLGFQSQSVSWEDTDLDVARWVLHGDRTSLRVLVYNFKDEPVEATLRTWLLDWGNYRIRSGPAEGEGLDVHLNQASQSDEQALYRYQPVRFNIPAHSLYLLEIEQLDSFNRRIQDLPDLALSLVEVNRDNRHAVVRVHNIGGADADGGTLFLEADGMVVDSRELPRLKAPVDLKPSVADFDFRLPDGSQTLRFRVQAKDDKPEITPVNNILELPAEPTSQDHSSHPAPAGNPANNPSFNPPANPQTPQSGLLLHASFDMHDGLQAEAPATMVRGALQPYLGRADLFPHADHAMGSPYPLNILNTKPVSDGRFGGAVRVPSGGALGFDTFGNLLTSRGTLAFWVRPNDRLWSAHFRGGRHPFIAAVRDLQNPLRINYFLGLGVNSRRQGIYHRRDDALRNTEALAGWGDDKDGSDGAFYHRIQPEWTADDWHHIALVWDAALGRKWYIDGEAVMNTWGTAPEHRAPYLDQLSLASNNSPNMLRTQDLGFDFDELYIFDYVLSAGQIRQLMEDNRIPVQRNEPDAEEEAAHNRWITDQYGVRNRDALPLIRSPGAAFTRIKPLFLRERGTRLARAIDGKINTVWPLEFKGPTLRGDYRKLDVYFDGTGDINFIRLTGTFSGDVYADDTKIASLAGDRFVQRVALPQPVSPERIRFVRKNGQINDLGFYFFSPLPSTPDTAWVAMGNASDAARELEAVSAYFAPEDRGLSGIGDALRLEPYRAYHFFSGPLETDAVIGGLAFNIRAGADSAAIPLVLEVHDPLTLTRLPLAIEARLSSPVRGGSQYRIEFNDVVIPLHAGNPLWFTIRAAIDEPVAFALDSVEYSLADEATFQRFLKRYERMLSEHFLQLSEAQRWNFQSGEDPARHYQGIGEMFAMAESILRFDPDNATASSLLSFTLRNSDRWLDEQARTRYTDPYADMEPPVIEGPAPDWARYGRAALKSLRRHVNWWIYEAQDEFGEFGSGINDDTTLMPEVVNFSMIGDPDNRLRDGLRKLADLAWEERLDNGINRRMTDHLHAFEEGTNLLGPTALLFYGDPVAVERLMLATQAVDGVLTEINPQGDRLFRSHYFNAAGQIREDISRDSGWALMLMPGRYLNWYNGNPLALQWLSEWQQSFLRRIPQEPDEFLWGKQGKMFIDFKTGELVDSGRHGPVAMPAHMYWLYWSTGDPRYIEPVLHNWREGRNVFNFGIQEWLQWRKLYPDDTIDAFAEARLGYPMDAWERGAADRSAIIDSLRQSMLFMERHLPVVTSVFQSADRANIPQNTMATMFLGGMADKAKRLNYHYHAVSWEGANDDVARFVVGDRPDLLEVLLYNFNDTPQKITMRVWKLDHGVYQIRGGVDTSGDESINELAFEEVRELKRFDGITLTLPTGVVYVLTVNQLDRLEDIRHRPDLAIGQYRQENNNLIVRIHNIGGSVSTPTTLELRHNGHVLGSVDVPAIEAPVDLVPRSVEVTLAGVGLVKGMELVLDPLQLNAEITRVNNRKMLN